MACLVVALYPEPSRSFQKISNTGPTKRHAMFKSADLTAYPCISGSCKRRGGTREKKCMSSGGAEF